MNAFRTVITTAALVLSTSANAALIALDDSIHGIDSLTFDDVSGLTWLDVSITAGMTYNQVFGELGSGGQFEGYRYATGAEVEQLLTSSGVNVDSMWTVENFAPINDLVQNYLGHTGDSFTSDASAVFSEAGENGGHKRVFIRTQDFMGKGFASLTSGTQYDNANEGEGHMLVVSESISTVPVPAAVWLFGSGLIGLVGFARRKKA